MHLRDYILYDDRVELIMTNDTICPIFFNANSGQIHFVYKNGKPSSIKHPGIYLGYDARNNGFYMHNHHITGKPAIVVENTFSEGKPIYLYEGISTNPQRQVIEIGLQQVLTGKPYNLVGYNCQSFVNIARQNKNRSEDVERIGAGLVFGGLVLLGIKALSRV
jgi:hypothetical protein